MALSEKVALSDVIFVGKVNGLSAPIEATPGVQQYADVEVEQVLKGSGVEPSIRVVTRGFISEENMLCCAIEERYIFFVRNGYNVFAGSGDDLRVMRDGVGAYYSSINGPYGSYLITSKKRVHGWAVDTADAKRATESNVIHEIRQIERGGFDACAAGSPCTLRGVLQMFPGEPAGAAVLSDGGRCAKLALPDAFYADPLRKQWHNKAVVVEGRAFAQPNTQTDMGVLSWYAEKDRKLATGMCDHGPGIYVDTLRSASGETWSGKR